MLLIQGSFQTIPCWESYANPSPSSLSPIDYWWVSKANNQGGYPEKVKMNFDFDNLKNDRTKAWDMLGFWIRVEPGDVFP